MKVTMTAGVTTYSTFSQSPVMKPPHGPIDGAGEGIGRAGMRQRRAHLGDAEDEAGIHDADDDAGDEQAAPAAGGDPAGNFGFATGGWGGLLVAGILIGIMYTGLVFCIAEISPALPHTGAAYSFARSSMGPWGGFITGLCENVEYVVTPAVIVTFITAYLNGIFAFDPAWSVTFVIFLALNIYGVALSYRVTLIITLLRWRCW